MSVYEEEQSQLKKSLEKIDDMARVLENVPRYRGDDFTQQVLEDRREHQRESLRSATVEPYFGRLDFKEWDLEKEKALYIGKVGVHDEESGEPLVVDWRAPVSSMFYSFNGSEEDVYYDSPEGIVEGEILLKRNLVVRSRELQRVVDSYTEGQEDVGGDEFLLYKLGEQKDSKLKDIVSTIQSEQNAIIRHALKEPLIIQGAAGSGKTTVALHRLAYLLYEYREQLRAERMMIFAPNAMFLDYISHVLPELGVGAIAQNTFAEWALSILGSPFTQATETNRLEVQFEQLVDQSSEAELVLKGSLAFKQMLTTYLEEYVAKLMPEKDFVAWEDGVLSVATIKEWIERDFVTSPPMKRRERMQARMKRWIEIEVKKFEDAKEQREMKSEALKRLRTFMRYWPKPDLAKLYISFLKEEKLSVSQYLKKSMLLHEDIAPMLYIHQILYGIEREDRFDHIVIDEAQDSSPFMISVLKERTRPGGFTILGDLAQGIHGNEGISSWTAFQEVFADKGISYVKMERSYRSTMEIIEFSNRILAQMKHSPGQAIPVFRSGQEVVIEQRGKDDIHEWVQQMEQKQAQTIAILTRTKEESTEVYEHLHSQGVTATLLQESDRTYRGGISVMPIYLAKGFEFDAVLLTDVSPRNYLDDEMHKKLLYVGCTRALHELSIWYTTKCSQLLER